MTFCGTDTSDHRLDAYRLIAQVAAGYAPDAPPERTLRGMTDVMRDMLAGEDIAPERLTHLQEFCVLVAEATLSATSLPPCGGGRVVGLNA